MPKYTIHFCYESNCSYERSVEIEAESAQHAEQIACDLYTEDAEFGAKFSDEPDACTEFFRVSSITDGLASLFQMALT